MNPHKAQMKISIANEIGADIEDQYEGQLKAAHEAAGSTAALRQAAQKIPAALIGEVDKDLKAGKIEDGLDAVRVGDLLRRWLTRVGDFLDHLADVEQQKAVAAGGRADGMKDAVELIAKMRRAEVVKLETSLELVKDGEGGTPADDAPRSAAEAARQANGTLEERRKKAELEKTKRAAAKPKKATKRTPKKAAKKKPAKKKPARRKARG